MIRLQDVRPVKNIDFEYGTDRRENGVDSAKHESGQ